MENFNKEITGNPLDNDENFLKEQREIVKKEVKEQFLPAPKDTLTPPEQEQINFITKFFPEGREFVMYEEDSAIQVVFSQHPHISPERIANLQDRGFMMLAEYNCKCCTDYVFILCKE